MALTKASMVQKVKDAYENATGKTMADDAANVLEFLCEGIINEIKTNGQVVVTVSGGSSSGTHQGTIN